MCLKCADRCAACYTTCMKGCILCFDNLDLEKDCMCADTHMWDEPTMKCVEIPKKDDMDGEGEDKVEEK